MKRILCLLLTLLCCVPFASCSSSVSSEDSFYLMDTLITVTLYEDEKAAKPIFARCRAIVGELNALWSRTEQDSDISRLNASETGLSDLDQRTVALLQAAQGVSSATGGAFDITVLPYVALWERCAEKKRLPTEEELAAAANTVGSPRFSVSDKTTVTKESGTEIDLGGIGKGEAISRLIAYLKTSGARGGVVSFGSNVAVFGKKPDGTDYRIALRDPKDTTAHVGVLTLSSGQILSVSGDYERFHTINGKRHHHILDPKTGYPAETGLSSVAVICRNGALADALSTALFVMGYESSMELYRSDIFDFEAIFIAQSGTITVTPGAKTFFEKV